MTMPATPDVCGSSSAPALALDLALAPAAGSGSTGRFLAEVAPGEVLRAVRRCLPRGGPEPVLLRLVRTELEPGRELTAEYGALVPPPGGVERRVAVTWVVRGGSAPGPDLHGEAEAVRRGVAAPFHRAWTGSDDQRMSVSVSPADDAFPQPLRLHDRSHLVDLLAAADATAGDGAAEDITVDTVRYRPRQRHVLHVSVGSSGPAWFLKVDALLQLRIAARRVPVQDPDWDQRVAGAVALATATLTEEPAP